MLYLFHTTSASALANHEHEDDGSNDENSPIKSASYMDELRQRLELVLSDPPSPVLLSSSPAPSQQISIPNEHRSCLPVSRSFRLPIQPFSTQVQSSTGYQPTDISRVRFKSTVPLQPQTNHLTSSTIKETIRGPTLIAPSKLKPNTTKQCLSSTVNLGTSSQINNISHQTPSITAGSTPLPRKQLPSLQLPDRNLSYRTTNNINICGYQSHLGNEILHRQQKQQQAQQMSKSFIMSTKRDGIVQF